MPEKENEFKLMVVKDKLKTLNMEKFDLKNKEANSDDFKNILASNVDFVVEKMRKSEIEDM